MATTKKKNTWGGKREGAGRKKGVQIKENPRNKMLPFRVSEITADRVKQLRAITKGEEHPFVSQFEEWVEQLAHDYGLE